MGIEDLHACEYWTEREGRAAVALWRRSGLGLTAFSRREGLSRRRLSYWRSRIDGSHDRSSVVLAPVTVLGGRSNSISIELVSGRVVRVEGQVDDALLALVIAVAERAC